MNQTTQQTGEMNNDSNNEPGYERRGDGLPNGIVRCPACETIGYRTDIYCPCCGVRMELHCEECGSVVVQPAGDRCEGCGSALTNLYPSNQG